MPFVITITTVDPVMMAPLVHLRWTAMESIPLLSDFTLDQEGLRPIQPQHFHAARDRAVECWGVGGKHRLRVYYILPSIAESFALYLLGDSTIRRAVSRELGALPAVPPAADRLLPPGRRFRLRGLEQSREDT